MCGDYVSSTTSAGFKAYPDFAKITASSLALRTKSSMDAQLLCSIPEGTVVAVSGMKDGWYKVIYGTQKGYINASYTSKSNGPATVIRTETEPNRIQFLFFQLQQRLFQQQLQLYEEVYIQLFFQQQ